MSYVVIGQYLPQFGSASHVGLQASRLSNDFKGKSIQNFRALNQLQFFEL